MADDTAKNELSKKISDIGLDKNYYKVYPLLGKVLDLKPLELHIFSIIYSYNSNGQEYTGSVSYLTSVLDATKKTILNNLQSLEDKNYIQKIQGDCKTTSKYIVNFAHINSYLNQCKNYTSIKSILVKKLHHPSVNFILGTSVKITPNNTIYNTNNKTSSSSKEEKNNNATTATNFEDDKEKEIQSVLDCYMNNINPSISPIEVERLQEDIKDYSSKWVLEAIKRAVLQGKRKLGYVEAILNRWRVDGYDEIGDKHKADQREPPQDKQDTGEKIHVLNSNESLIQEYYKNKGANKNEHSS